MFTRITRHALLAILATLTAFATSSLAANYMTVIKDGVNVRSGPSTKSEVYWEVFKDFPVKVLKKKNGWLKTKDFEGDTGWIYAPLLVNNKKVIVKVKKANLRVGPGKNYEIVATALYGVVFTPGRTDGNWIQVTHSDGTKGWLHKSLLWP